MNGNKIATPEQIEATPGQARTLASIADSLNTHGPRTVSPDHFLLPVAPPFPREMLAAFDKDRTAPALLPAYMVEINPDRMSTPPHDLPPGMELHGRIYARRQELHPFGRDDFDVRQSHILYDILAKANPAAPDGNDYSLAKLTAVNATPISMERDERRIHPGEHPPAARQPDVAAAAAPTWETVSLYEARSAILYLSSIALRNIVDAASAISHGV